MYGKTPQFTLYELLCIIHITLTDLDVIHLDFSFRDVSYLYEFAESYRNYLNLSVKMHGKIKNPKFKMHFIYVNIR